MSDLLQQAVAAHQEGDLARAERLYREILAKRPDHPDALALLGVVLDAKGDHAHAIELIERAITRDPKSPLFKFYLGNALMGARRVTEAAAVFRQAVTVQPNMAQGWYNLGNALRDANDWPGAIDAFRHALVANPKYAEASNNLALALAQEKQHDEAMRQAEKTVRLASDYGEGWLGLCNIAEQAGQHDRARTAGEQAFRLMPGNHKAWFGYGVALSRLQRFEDSVAAYKRALAIEPNRADIWDNLGQSYQALNRLEEAEDAYRKSVDAAAQTITNEAVREVAEEEYGNRHWHLALVELLRGKLKEGFARYRARFKDVGGLKRPVYPSPLWRGENLNDKTILITDEQGFGDTLMFCRYLPLLKKQGARVIFAVHPALAPLFQDWSGADEIVVHGQRISYFDYHAATFDLPHRLGTTFETIPNNVPYLPLLEPDDATRLESGGKPKVGVVWGGSPLHKNDANRSVPLELFAKLFDAIDAQFFSLNRDLKPGDSALLPRLSVIDLAPRLKTFADAARFMRQLDLVITCDTASAHLAGGLGVPVWTLLPFAPDWRWMLKRDDSPWYPTMKLFRQPRIGDWESVVAQVKNALTSRTKPSH